MYSAQERGLDSVDFTSRLRNSALLDAILHIEKKGRQKRRKGAGFFLKQEVLFTEMRKKCRIEWAIVMKKERKRKHSRLSMHPPYKIPSVRSLGTWRMAYGTLNVAQTQKFLNHCRCTPGTGQGHRSHSGSIPVRK